MTERLQKVRVVFSVTNNICNDQRVRKIAGTVSELGCEITIVGRKLGKSSDVNSIPFRIKRFSMIYKKGFLFYAFFNIRLFFYLLLHKYDVLVADDLDTLMPNFLISKLKGMPVVYDSHEYFTGVPELLNRPFVKWVWTVIEKMIFPHLKYIMTVSDSIAQQYEELYGVKPLVVRNAAKNCDNIVAYSKEEIGVPENNLLLIIQGTGINKDKGAEELIDAMKITDGVFLIVVGSGDVVPQLKQMIDNSGLALKVRLIPTVPWEELIKYTKSADIGMCLEKDTNLNYRFSLPNKLFNYLASGIPVIAGFLPESGSIIKEYNCGLIIPSVKAEEISNAIKKLRDDRVLLDILRHNSIIASKSFTWEKESEKVTDFYKSVLK